MQGGALRGALGSISSSWIMKESITSGRIISGAVFGMVGGLFIGVGKVGGQIVKANSIQKALGLDGAARDSIQELSDNPDLVPKLNKGLW